MKKSYYFLLILLSFFHTSTYAQDANVSKVPSSENLEKAKDIAEIFFNNMKNKKYSENADFIVGRVGGAWDESKKISERNSYRGKFELIGLRPPGGVYGNLDGFDLIEQGYLNGSSRYFRNTYIGYHESSVLIYEFRFYVNSKNEVTLHYIGWSEKNPFEYMSTSDMLLPKWDK